MMVDYSPGPYKHVAQNCTELQYFWGDYGYLDGPPENQPKRGKHSLCHEDDLLDLEEVVEVAAGSTMLDRILYFLL
jgi:hypothetical protein